MSTAADKIGDPCAENEQCTMFLGKTTCSVDGHCSCLPGYHHIPPDSKCFPDIGKCELFCGVILWVDWSGSRRRLKPILCDWDERNNAHWIEYNSARGSYSPDDGVSTFLRDAGIYLQVHTGLQPRKTFLCILNPEEHNRYRTGWNVWRQCWVRGIICCVQCRNMQLWIGFDPRWR